MCKNSVPFSCSHAALRPSLLHDGEKTKYLIAGAEASTVKLVIDLMTQMELTGRLPDDIPLTEDNYSALLQTSVWLQVPSLFVLSLAFTFTKTRHDMPLLYQIVSESFFAKMPPVDCLRLKESLFFDDVMGSQAVFDMYWYHRCVEEFDTQYKAYAQKRRQCFMSLDPLKADSGKENWARIYAELSLRACFLHYLAASPLSQESNQNKDGLAHLVQLMDLTGVTECAMELPVLATWCPNLQALNLSNTGVRDSSVVRLVDACTKLRWLNLAGSATTAPAIKHLKEIYPQIKLVWHGVS